MKTFVFSLFVTFVQCDPLYMNHQVQEDYVPILGYHSIGGVTNSLTITLEDYRDQVDYLTNTMNCNWITMKDLSDYVVAGDKLPTDTCIMNFDDGTSDHYHAGLCSLNEHGVPATYYIAPLNLGTSGFYMTSGEVDNLYDLGHDIASHTLTHAHLAQLTYAQQEVEILDTKDVLEAMGYDVSTFAYPFGEYNEDTLNILRNDNGYALTRDTSQDSSWKDVRAPVVSFNADSDLHFYYIKPEGLSGSQLADLIKYTGWWQFEDNYKIIVDTTNEIKIRSSASYLPTDTSYGVVLTYGVTDEISTQFITKKSGGFTLDMLLSGPNGFSVKVDGVVYTPEVFPENDPGKLSESSGSYDFFNYYVNIPSLSPGVHTLNIINTEGVTMVLDKFRLWSSVNQDFRAESPYNNCNPAVDDYCTCDAPMPVPDPTCELGLVKDNICCSLECGECGNSGCGDLKGGASNCCAGPIESSGVSCDDDSAPCIISVPVPDPTCELGIVKDNICCSPGCATCGGLECGVDPLGGSNCCGGPIVDSGVSCDDDAAPCILTVPDVIVPDPTCELGLVKDNICCSLECGECGNSGCGDLDGGPSNCCAGPIESSGVSCDDSAAPCIIRVPVPDPTCELGTVNDNICCSSECLTCGGVDCGIDPLGGSNCCGGPIIDSGVSCDDDAAPCIITVPDVTVPTSDPTCSVGYLGNNGAVEDGICCPLECGACGGSGCGGLPGGSSNCCGGTIAASGISCETDVAPCVMGV